MSRLLLVGAAGLDTLSFVSSYPAEDEKVRSYLHMKDGGGNAANTASTTSKLGVRSFLMSLVGDDTEAETILAGLHRFGVNTSYVLKLPESHSGTTFVIVSTNSGTRTCIHNPMIRELLPADVESINMSMGVFRMVHFDSRHTLASAVLAKKAAEASKLISIDIEKLRPHVLELLPYCDIIFTNAVFPSTLALPGCSRDDQILNMFTIPWAAKCKMIVATYGSGGSVLCRKACSTDVRHSLPAEEFVDANYHTWASMQTFIQSNTHLTIEKVSILYEGVEYEMIRCSAWPLNKCDVLDTTGAGDAFIGGFLTALLRHWDMENCMKLGTVVAAEKIKKYGAREGLPDVHRLLENTETAYTT